jgi:NAD(P)-dependent dehydrogenase (short-subunit alcohol dehydrogenase family)
VCNVGISSWQKIKTQSVEDFDHSVAVNVTSNWVTAQAALPGMLERGHGAFVFVTSAAVIGEFVGLRRHEVGPARRHAPPCGALRIARHSARGPAGWITLLCAQGQIDNLWHAMGRPDLAADERTC